MARTPLFTTSLACVLLLLLLGSFHVHCQSASESSEPCDAKVSQLKSEAKRCQQALGNLEKSLKAATAEREALEAKASKLGELLTVA